MQNSKNKLIVTGALLILIGSVFYFRSSSKTNSTNYSNETNLVKKSAANLENNILPEKFVKNDVLAKSEEFSKFSNFELNEKKSLLILASFINDASSGDLKMDTLVEDLKNLKLKPIVMKNNNEYTGSLDIIRTKTALPGTRYLHAQYFEGENTTSFLQHLSFEFKGGDNAFEMVKQSIKMQMKLTSPPIEESKTYISWRVGEKIVWIKVLSLEDISKANPFNSYDLKNDVGTIRVTIENEIH